jgi:hypothetical protein
MRLLLYVVPLVVMLYALIDCLQTARAEARNLPKWLWLVLVVVVPLLGAIGWLTLGRPRRGELVGVGSGRSRRQSAPDDDPTFLRELDDQVWQRRMRERRDEGGDPGSGSG